MCAAVEAVREEVFEVVAEAVRTGLGPGEVRQALHQVSELGWIDSQRDRSTSYVSG